MLADDVVNHPPLPEALAPSAPFHTNRTTKCLPAIGFAAMATIVLGVAAARSLGRRRARHAAPGTIARWAMGAVPGATLVGGIVVASATSRGDIIYSRTCTTWRFGL